MSLGKSECNSNIVRNVLALVHDVRDHIDIIYVDSKHLTIPVDADHTVSLRIPYCRKDPRVSNFLSVNEVPIGSFIDKQVPEFGYHEDEPALVNSVHDDGEVALHVWREGHF